MDKHKQTAFINRSINTLVAVWLVVTVLLFYKTNIVIFCRFHNQYHHSLLNDLTFVLGIAKILLQVRACLSSGGTAYLFPPHPWCSIWLEFHVVLHASQPETSTGLLSPTPIFQQRDWPWRLALMSGGRNIVKAKTRKMFNVTIACTALSSLCWDWCLYWFLYQEKGVYPKMRFSTHIKGAF